MNLYTLVFIFVTILVLLGIAVFGFLVLKLDKWIDKKERLGTESIVKSGNKNSEKSVKEKSS